MLNPSKCSVLPPVSFGGINIGDTVNFVFMRRPAFGRSIAERALHSASVKGCFETFRRTGCQPVSRALRQAGCLYHGF